MKKITEKEYALFAPADGIRTLIKPNASPVSHLGLIIGTGSRDERKGEEGMAHFIEHALFKGTEKRKSFHVISRLDSVGGELNAFTTKEDTCLYASFPAEYLERAMELLADIIMHSSFPEKELEKEKEIVLDEIRTYKDSPSEDIFDVAEEYLFKGHPLAHNILGKPSSVKKFRRENLLQFIRKNYCASRMVLAFSGATEEKKVLYLAEKYFGGHSFEKSSERKRHPYTDYASYHKSVTRDSHQAHCVISAPAYDTFDTKKTGMILLANLLGGPGMNSLLNLSLREKHAYCYHVESNYVPFSDNGVFNIYFATDPENVEKCISLSSKELERLRKVRITETRLTAMKKQVAGQIMLSQLNEASVVLGFGKSVLLYNKVDSLEDTLKKVHAVTSRDLQTIANEIFKPARLSQLIYEAIPQS